MSLSLLGERYFSKRLSARELRYPHFGMIHAVGYGWKAQGDSASAAVNIAGCAFIGFLDGA